MAPAFFAGGLIWRDISVNPRFPSSLTASNEFVSHPGAMSRQGQVPFSTGILCLTFTFRRFVKKPTTH